MTENTPPPRRRKRKIQRRAIDTSVPSPCVQLCQLEKDTRTCTGCFRTADEIRDWIILDAEAKRHVWSQLDHRKQQLNGLPKSAD